METKTRDATVEQHWIDFAAQFQIRPDTIYLNHGSFSPAANEVRYARRQWIDRLDEQPMDFYLRQIEKALADAREALAKFVGTTRENLIFADNATYGMNIIAKSTSLKPGDEVLLNDHEYGAVVKIWQRECDQAGAILKVVELPDKFESKNEIVDSIAAGITDKTRIAIVSHITSATALVMPVKEICHLFSERGTTVCVDGPHALAQVDFSIDDLDCDFYTASCHKWLCGTLGTGFLYVNPRQQKSVVPPIKSWGRLRPGTLETWDDEFTWLGTRDPSPFLSIPNAIEFMERLGLEKFRERSRYLASYAERELMTLFGTTPIGNRDQGWYASMAHVPLPPGDWSELQKQLWEEVGIEVMINQFKSKWHVRVACHLYNNKSQIDTLIKTLKRLTS